MDAVTLQIETLAYQGRGVAHRTDGKTVFVPHTAPGDVVRAAIADEKKSFCTAQVVEVVQPGPDRIPAPCPLAGTCGGCQWQHVAYSAQLAAKRLSVVSALQRIAHFDATAAENAVAPCLPCKRTLGYRNKLELAATRDGAGRLVLGLHGEGDAVSAAGGGAGACSGAPTQRESSAGVVPVTLCPLAHKAIQGAPKALQGALRYLEGSDELGIFRVGIRHSLRTKQTEIALWTTPGAFPRAQAATTLASALAATSIVRVVAQPGKARAVKNVEVLSGAGNWEEELGEFSYRVSAPSFFQVNTAQAEVLQGLVMERLGVSAGSYVADLYAGVGTFTLPLAARNAAVVAVESSGPAVRDLRRNAQRAGVDVDVVGGDSARELPDLGALDALVVDPPRAGLANGVAQSIAAAAPEKVAYVSCDPATWARDVAALQACGYRLVAATPVDLFPQTYHVEVVSAFARV